MKYRRQFNLQKNTLFDQVSKLPMVTENHSVTINTEGDKDLLIPPMSITFDIKSDNGYRYMDSCYVVIKNRGQEGLKEYPMDDVGVRVYYNSAKKVCSLLFMSQEKTDASSPSAELVELLSTLKDEEAIQAYRMAAWYWIALDYGHGVMAGEYVALQKDELEEISEGSDLYSEEDDDEEDLEA
jgi:hypothetical protein